MQSRKPNHLFTLGRLMLVIGLCVSSTAYAQSGESSTPTPTPAPTAKTTYPSDDNKLIGDHIRLRTNVEGFTPIASSATDAKCAPIGSRFLINFQSADASVYFLRFLTVTNEDDHFLNANDDAALKACPKERRVNGHTEYKLAASQLEQIDHKRTGITFGGLVVPFKFRLGGSKELISSSTVAPYIGFRTGWAQSYGLTITPVLSAGLSLVPVADAANKTTTAKSAFTFAGGMRMTSNKNENFSAGLLVGRDFLSQADRDADPNVSKNWLSFYLGYAL